MKAAAGGAAPCDFVLRGAAELVTMSGTDGLGLIVARRPGGAPGTHRVGRSRA